MQLIITPFFRYLGSGSYDISSDQDNQTFFVASNFFAQTPLVKFLTLKVLNNHGHPNYTCIYDFKVFGFHELLT